MFSGYFVTQIPNPSLLRCADARLRRRVSCSHFSLSMRGPYRDINVEKRNVFTHHLSSPTILES